MLPLYGARERLMKKHKRKRRRRVRITAKGYVLLGILLLVILFVARVCTVCYSRSHPEASKPAQNPAAASNADASAPESDAPDASSAPAVTAAPTPTPTSTPELASTGARLPTEAEREGAVEGVIRTSNVAMRKGAGKSYDIVRKYDVGERVLVYAQENEYSLVQVLSDERYGFLATDFITKFGLLPGESGACTPVPAIPAGVTMGLVNVEEVSLRSVPSTKSNTPLGVCKNGALLFVQFQTGEFYYVEVAETKQRGYVFSEYVMVQAPVPTGSPAPGG